MIPNRTNNMIPTSIRKLLPTRPGEPCGACRRRHRTWKSIAMCVLDFSVCIWLVGDPPVNGPCWCSVSDCPSCLEQHFRTVFLLPNQQTAEEAKAAMDAMGCGGRCRRAHYTVGLHLSDGGMKPTTSTHGFQDGQVSQPRGAQLPVTGLGGPGLVLA
jgi:hypothetical protein